MTVLTRFRQKKVEKSNNINSNKIINWYRCIKTKYAMKRFIKFRNELDIEIEDYYLEKENCWNHQGLNDDITIDLKKKLRKAFDNLKMVDSDIEIIERSDIKKETNWLSWLFG